ncbi:uncharacterized protein BDR25DRAFT_302123 [Lindgomyces ingoldianus]|uniref:Uncharacterized protein n=1 Tax=Lindgomyces ingoldianus TaxID=673940 RepID=A0ACB6R1Q7_9PLEO|nr:uncharacterized protein BDR25DRAFT_302123 [Lindgomyces ingoldianus]KAF2473116.1 hypothetical protein BDR25DRAFT_302123 [Lindgomyces ingoldianus]
MKFFTIASGLVAAVSAIDIRLRSGGGCTGTYVACVGINPNTCCSNGGTAFIAVGAVAIPSNWRIELRTYQNGGCNTLRGIQGSGGVTNMCISENDGIARLTGGGWNFSSKKRNAGAAACSTTGCTSTVKPDILVLEDETTTFAIAEMEESLLNVLMDYAINGTQAADLPQVYEPYKIET